MVTLDELINEPVIKRYMDTHRSASSRILAAAELLVGEKDALASLKKVLPALVEKEVNVFFSYKAKDELAAQTVIDVLRRSSASKLKVTHQGDFRNIVGKLWRTKIREAVQNANWFILLFPDTSDDWDWCLFETGLFEARYTSADRLICLHHPGTEIPDPIKEYHAVPATISKVEEFLHMVLIDNNPVPGLDPINPYEEPSIPEFAKEIVEAIRPPKECLFREIFEPWIELQIDDPANLENIDDLDQAKILNSNKEARSLFGYRQMQHTWGKLRSGLLETETDDRWRKELFHVIKKIAKGMEFTPIQAVFKTNDGRIFRPVACAVDRIGNEEGPISIFHITFTEEVGTLDSSSIPHDLLTLAFYMRFTFRFRWEILERFSKRPLTEEDIERLQNALERINADAKSRGIEGIDTILDLFTPEQAGRIKQMYYEWSQVRNAEKSGELDIAIKNKEVEKIPEILARFIPVTQEFLELASDRFSKLVIRGSDI